MTLTKLSPADAAARIRAGHAMLIDIREPDEFARRHIPGALSHPLSALDATPLPLAPDVDCIVTCQSGLRTTGNAARLEAAGARHVLDGGVAGWAAAGLPVETNAKAPLEMVRQVHITAGLLILTGVLLALTVAPSFIWLAAFVGAGLTFAGATGFCGMAHVLAPMPWNRAAA